MSNYPGSPIASLQSTWFAVRPRAKPTQPPGPAEPARHLEVVTEPESVPQPEPPAASEPAAAPEPAATPATPPAEAARAVDATALERDMLVLKATVDVPREQLEAERELRKTGVSSWPKRITGPLWAVSLAQVAVLVYLVMSTTGWLPLR